MAQTDPASPHIQALVPVELSSGAHANITISNTPLLVNGSVYSISYDVVDLAGNNAVTVTNTNITYDIATQTPVLAAPSSSSYDNSTFAIDFTLPEAALGGTAKMIFTQTGGVVDPNSPHVVTFAPGFEAAGNNTTILNGADLSSNVNVASVSSDPSDALVDGAVYSIAIEYQDLAGNVAANTTNANITYDVTLPVITAATPVTGTFVKDTKVSYTLSEPVLSGTITWTRTGGAADGTVHTQALTGAELNSGAHTNITLTNAPTLVDGTIYSIAYDVIDLAGNAAVTITNTNVTYDVSLPVISATTPVAGSYVKDTKVSYTLSEAALSGTITWTQTAGTVDGTVHTQALTGAELNSGAHTNITLTNAPVLVDGAIYSIAYDMTDLAGNNAVTVTNTNVTYDVTAPVVSATAPVNNAMVNSTKVSYTLSEAVLSGTITWTQTGGTVDPASPQIMALTGAELGSGIHAGITLGNAPVLVDGTIYSITYDVTDLAGNNGLAVVNTNITYDATLPVISAAAPVTGSYVKDTKVSYTLSEAALSGTITWTQTGGTADVTIHTQALTGAELNSGAHANITLTNAPILVDGAIYTIAYDVTDLAGNNAVTVTNTNVTYDVSVPVISATTPVTGSFVKDTKVSYTLSEVALSGTLPGHVLVVQSMA